MLTDEQIAKLKADNAGAELTVIANEDVGIEVVVKTPNDAEWRRFRAQSSDDAQKSGALRFLVLACVKHPDAAAFMGAVNAKPGIIETIGNKLVEIAGVSMATTTRKL